MNASYERDLAELAIPVTRSHGGARNADQLTWPLGLELYLPQQWLEKEKFRDRRQQCDVPEEITFQTKPEIALDLLADQLQE